MKDIQIKARQQSRRNLLQFGWKSAAAILALGGARLSASSGTGRVLVQLQLFGGNDSNNMIVPMDAVEYRRYANSRGPLAIPSSSLLPIDAPRQNARYGLHPQLVELHDLYQRKSLAVVANTGILPYPMTRQDVLANGIPAGAQQHLTPQVAYVKDGFTTAAWTLPMLGLGNEIALRTNMFTFPSGVSMVSTTASSNGAPRDNYPVLLSAMARAPIRTAFPNTPLGRELKNAAQLIYAAPAVGASDMAILCSQCGYDTHVDEVSRQPKLFADLSACLYAFQSAMVEIGAANRVTLYTQTEFNRTMPVNQTGGSEHGWGSHQLVLGNAVLGGDIYGTFQHMAVGGAGDAASNGTWIPSTSNDQYHATLASWMGVGLSRLATAFPALSRFTTQNLGFVA